MKKYEYYTLDAYVTLYCVVGTTLASESHTDMVETIPAPVDAYDDNGNIVDKIVW